MSVPCGRWRECRGCAIRLGWRLRQRFIAGIESVEAPFLPMFFTLTFPAPQAPDESEAHSAWRALVGRLRYRGQLGPYGWVLQRQVGGTLHYHGIAHMPWQSDRLEMWRYQVVEAGFGPQNRLEVAGLTHASYCARYISRNLASLSRLRRAYSFSPGFPRPPEEPGEDVRELADALGEIGAGALCEFGRSSPDCEWYPGDALDALLSSA